MVNVRKRGNGYEYRTEIAPVDGKRKWISKSGFRTKSEAEKAGIMAYNEYMQTGHKFVPSSMSFSDFLDYWFKEHCQVNLKYHTLEAYSLWIWEEIQATLWKVLIPKICKIITRKEKDKKGIRYPEK